MNQLIFLKYVIRKEGGAEKLVFSFTPAEILLMLTAILKMQGSTIQFLHYVKYETDNQHLFKEVEIKVNQINLIQFNSSLGSLTRSSHGPKEKCDVDISC